MPKKILIISFLFLALPALALAQCRWTPYQTKECYMIGPSWVPDAQQGASCKDEDKGINTACCCGPDNVKLGCCNVSTVFGSGSGTHNVKRAYVFDEINCPTNFFSPYPLYYPGLIANDEQFCAKATNKCFWTLLANCSDIGFTEITDPTQAVDKCKGTYKAPGGTSKCCCGPQSGNNLVAGCCQIKETDTKNKATLIETAEMLSDTECNAKNTLQGAVGKVVKADFFANKILDANKTKCVDSPNKGSGGTGSAGVMVRSVHNVFPNPLGSTSQTLIDLPEIINKVIKALIGIVGSIALLVFIYGGFVWMTSAGNDSRVAQGKNILLWATVALVIMFLAWILLTFVFQAIGVIP